MPRSDEEPVEEEESSKWDEEAAMQVRKDGASTVFPMPVKEYKIYYGNAFAFDAKEFLHAGGPGK